MNVEAVKDGIKVATGTAWNAVKENSPIILTVAGCIGVGAGVFLACKATRKLDDALDESTKELHDLHNLKELVTADSEVVENENGETLSYTNKDYAKDAIVTYRNLLWRFTKLYGVSALVLSASMAAIICSYSIQSNRVEAAVAACALSERIFTEYRDRVVAKYGEEEDKKLYFGTHEETVEEIVYDENGNPKTNKNGEVKTKSVTKEVLNDGTFDIRFDMSTSGLSYGNCRNDKALCELVQTQIQKTVIQDGSATMLEVVRLLGLENLLKDPDLVVNDTGITGPEYLAMCNVAGWIFDPYGRIEGHHAPMVSFGIDDDFDLNPVLHFNCEPTIISSLPEVYKKYTIKERYAAFRELKKGFNTSEPIIIDGELVE